MLRLLSEVQEKKITLNELSVECNTLKSMVKVQNAFVKGTNSSSWEDAVKKYLSFCTSEQLEPFTKLQFKNNVLPTPFLQFCQKTIKLQNQDEIAGPSNTLSDDIFYMKNGSNMFTIVWGNKCLEINASNISEVFAHAGQEYHGFSLSIFDLTDNDLVVVSYLN